MLSNAAPKKAGVLAESLRSSALEVVGFPRDLFGEDPVESQLRFVDRLHAESHADDDGGLPLRAVDARHEISEEFYSEVGWSHQSGARPRTLANAASPSRKQVRHQAARINRRAALLTRVVLEYFGGRDAQLFAGWRRDPACRPCG